MGIKMIVKKPFRPTGSGSRLLKVGEEYTAADGRQAQFFRSVGFADFAAPPLHVVYTSEAATVLLPALLPADDDLVSFPLNLSDGVLLTSTSNVVAEEIARQVSEHVDGEFVCGNSDSDISPRTGKPKRQYRRRDMTAEGAES